MATKYIRLLLVLLTAGLANVAQGANLVTNSGFETGDFSGWSLSGTDSDPSLNGFLYGVDSADAHSGAYGAYFGPVGGVLNLDQSLPTSPGANYAITFWLAQSPATPGGYVNSVSVAFHGTTLFSQTTIPESGFTEYSFSATATAGSSVLSFGFRDDTGFFSLDDVSVTPESVAAVPEPGTGLLLLPGFVYVMFRRFRRNAFKVHLG